LLDLALERIELGYRKRNDHLIEQLTNPVQPGMLIGQKPGCIIRVAVLLWNKCDEPLLAADLWKQMRKECELAGGRV
jgi:hypothetical protein